MAKLYLLLASILVGVAVALTYFLFEATVHQSVAFVWGTVFRTETNRLVVVPLCLVLTLVYFGVQHFWDKEHEKSQELGLGSMPAPTMLNFTKILVIGFLSLLAGASLGPEAILVPSCLLIGAYAGTKLFKSDKRASKILAAAGVVALFAAFFNSFIVGVLSVLFVVKQAKTKITPAMLALAITASASSSLTLYLIGGKSYFHLPALSWGLTFGGALVLIILLILGAATTFLLAVAHGFFVKWYGPFAKSHAWWVHAIVASVGLSALYLIGGPLVQFTGNESIVPLFEQAGSLGLVGLFVIYICKVAAIAWSKALGYRGGLVFPTVFVAAVLVVFFAQITDVNFVYGFVAALIGALAADAKAKVLV